MKDFFNVKHLPDVLALAAGFTPVAKESISIFDTGGRILAENIISDTDLPDFSRSTMDGFAVRAVSTFGASEANPGYLTVIGTIAMGEIPNFSLAPGQTARISTGGMLPEGADGVVMIEHTAEIDETTIEVYRSIAPGQHMVEKGEDFQKEETVLSIGRRIRPQEAGLLAGFGKDPVKVFKKPVVGIISTGDEVVPIDQLPGRAQIRDINTYTLSCLVANAGGDPLAYGIVRDEFDALRGTCALALDQCDMVLISGGSSVGVRDYTIEAISALPESNILVHGISISPGKPTILAKVKDKPFWGLPGHVVSAMIVFQMVVKPFLESLSGVSRATSKVLRHSAVLSRNLASAQGRIDFVRVKLSERDGVLIADPILGKSGLINTMVKADGLIEIDMNTEGLDKGSKVQVIPF
jgi:molybdopterin molybdotransferase